MLLRVLLIITLIGYLLYKLGLFRVSVHSNVRGRQTNANFNRKPAGGNVHVDTIPNKEKKEPTYKGGEYIDYEEVK